MPGLPIAVEITPPDAPREHVAVLLAACSRASADAECVPAADVAVTATRAVALVTWSGERRVVIEVGLRKDGRPEWRSRTLEFERIDDAVERWRTIGFVVGTLSRPEIANPEPSERAPEVDPKKPAPTRTPARPKESAVRPPKAPSKPVMEPSPRARAPAEPAVASRPAPAPGGALDVGGVFGPGLKGTRSGGLVRGRFQLADVLGAIFAVRYLDRPIGDGSFGGRWVTGCAGVGVQLGSETVAFAVAVDARGEYFQARAEMDPLAEQQARFLPGVGLGMNVGWMPVRALGLFVGGDAAAMFGTTEVRVSDEFVATDEALRFAIEGGVRIRLW